jgi:aminopeptidase N
MVRRWFAVGAVALALTAATRGGPAHAAGIARLTGDAVPVAYDLTIAPGIIRHASAGSETIDVLLHRPLDAIALNARKVDIVRASIDGRMARVETLPAIEQILVHSATPLRAGPHRVELTFASTIGTAERPEGLYDVDGAHLATIFEPSTARSMFPCFDEPQFRARFTLHVRAPAAWTVISNMPLRARHPAAQRIVQNDFAPTPPMPVYLLTLDAGVYAHADAVAGTIPIRVFVRPGQEAQARAVAARAQRIIPFFERYFGIPFPLPKLDIVVSPGVLQSALEGWGSITMYSEGMAFGGPAGDRGPGDRDATEVLAHEIAHQWAGDLVTMRWWSDTFVAEALAEFAQRQAVREVFPELRSWRDDDRIVAGIMRNGVRKGSRAAVHPILTDLQADANDAFSLTTYDKGASVIESWRDAVGDARFRVALHGYLTRYAYGSATFDDLWSALGGPAGIAYGRSWLLQRGYIPSSTCARPVRRDVRRSRCRKRRS